MSGQLHWFKSSHSDDEGDNCLEVALDRRKSTHSNGEEATLHIRDPKLPAEAGPQLTVSAWSAFLATEW